MYYSEEAVARHEERQRVQAEEDRKRLMEKTTEDEWLAGRAKIEAMLAGKRNSGGYQPGIGAVA